MQALLGIDIETSGCKALLIGTDGVSVTDGLRPGEQVVSAGATRLVDGQQVKVLTD